MRTAIIGLPMVGKTSLFTILTGIHEATRVGLLEARVGVTPVPDPRLEELAAVFSPLKVTPAALEYLDFPAVSRESLRDPGFVASLRVADAFAHVVRLFASDTVPHERGTIDPTRDVEDLETELILSDLVVVEKRLERVDKDRKKIRSTELDREFDLLVRCRQALEENRPLRAMTLDAGGEKRIRGFQFLSRKPMLFVLNIGEQDAPRLREIEEGYRQGALGGRPQTAVTAVCGNVEAELAELSGDEARELLASYGLKESALDRLITATYSLLGLMSFLTAGETEVRAWTVPIGSTAVRAAGAIHTDFEKKFIRAEVVPWKDLVDCGGYAGAREKAHLRLEGREYVVRDGDVLVIRHG
ncbi:MAG: redox-regulated ATPase YchF [Bryobacteraceae bacterium]